MHLNNKEWKQLQTAAPDQIPARFPTLAARAAELPGCPGFASEKTNFKEIFLHLFYRFYLIVNCYAREASVKPLQSENTGNG